jgi:hypothetical protein
MRAGNEWYELIAKVSEWAKARSAFRPSKRVFWDCPRRSATPNVSGVLTRRVSLGPQSFRRDPGAYLVNVQLAWSIWRRYRVLPVLLVCRGPGFVRVSSGRA